MNFEGDPPPPLFFHFHGVWGGKKTLSFVSRVGCICWIYIPGMPFLLLCFFASKDLKMKLCYKISLKKVLLFLKNVYFHPRTRFSWKVGQNQPS